MSYLQEKPFQFWGFFAVVVIVFFWLFQPILAPFIVGFAVAYLLNPIVAKLEAKKIPRWLSALFILGLFFIIIIVGLVVAVPILIREMIEFVKLMPMAFVTVQDWFVTKFPTIEIPQSFDDVKNMDASIISERLGSVFEFSKNILGNVFKSGMAIIGFVTFLVLMPIVAFYLLIDWSRVTNKISDLMPKKNAKKYQICCRILIRHWRALSADN